MVRAQWREGDSFNNSQRRKGVHLPSMQPELTRQPCSSLGLSVIRVEGSTTKKSVEASSFFRPAVGTIPDGFAVVYNGAGKRAESTEICERLTFRARVTIRFGG
jgi:hypothetical protein